MAVGGQEGDALGEAAADGGDDGGDVLRVGVVVAAKFEKNLGDNGKCVLCSGCVFLKI